MQKVRNRNRRLPFRQLFIREAAGNVIETHEHKGDFKE